MSRPKLGWTFLLGLATAWIWWLALQPYLESVREREDSRIQSDACESGSRCYALRGHVTDPVARFCVMAFPEFGRIEGEAAGDFGDFRMVCAAPE